MSNYNKATNFAVKDTLTSGDPDKVVSGAEIDNEFNAIASAVTSKTDKVAAATTDNLASLDANGNLKDSGVASADATVPSGGIIMWSGLLTSIPSGWELCDGNNGTPDLRNRFIVGAGDQYNRNDTGGQNSVQLTVDEMPSHSHSGVPSYTLSSGDTEGGAGRVTGNSSTNSTGGNQAHENRPPYFALAFIMKT